MIVSAAHQYFLETGADEVSFQQLSDYLPLIEPVAGESYEDLVITIETEFISVTLEDGQEISFEF